MVSEDENLSKLVRLLIEAGWRNDKGLISGNFLAVEMPVSNNPKLIADCVLYIDYKAAAIIEVKNNTNKNLLIEALKQAQKYAENYDVSNSSKIGTPLPFIFAYNGERIYFRDLQDKKSNPKDIRKFYTPFELKQMLQTIPYGPTNVTQNKQIFLNYLKLAIILVYINSDDKIQEYFQSRFSGDKCYVIKYKKYGIKRILQLAYFLFDEVYLMNPENDIFNINTKKLNEIKLEDFLPGNFKLNILQNAFELMKIQQGKRIEKTNKNVTNINYALNFVRDTESYAIPIYNDFKNSGESFITFGNEDINTNEKETIIYKIIKKLISDKPASEDLVGRNSDAERLASFLANEETQTPINLAIISEWGNGKSSFNQFMINTFNKINEEKNKYTGKLSFINFLTKNSEIIKKLFAIFRNKSITKIINFNAWQYNNDEQIGIALAHDIYKKLNLRQKFCFIFKKHTIKEWIFIAMLFIFALISSLLFIKRYQIVSFLTGIFDFNIDTIINVLSLLTSGGLVLAIAAFVKNITGIIFEMFSYRYSHIYKDTIETKYKIKNDICKILKHIGGNKNRIIVFIDDLDRCKKDSIINLLDSLLIYFSEDCNISIILNIDIEIIISAVKSKLDDIYEENSSDIKAMKYLDKIIQINYNIPKVEQYNQLIDKLVPTIEIESDIPISKTEDTSETQYKGIDKDPDEETLPETNSDDNKLIELSLELPEEIKKELKLFLQQYGEILEFTPRKIKRIINILKILINDLTSNIPELNQENIAKTVCILEKYPEITQNITKELKNDDEEINIKESLPSEIKDKIEDIKITKSYYKFIRKYIYDVSFLGNKKCNQNQAENEQS